MRPVAAAKVRDFPDNRVLLKSVILLGYSCIFFKKKAGRLARTQLWQTQEPTPMRRVQQIRSAIGRLLNGRSHSVNIFLQAGVPALSGPDRNSCSCKKQTMEAGTCQTSNIT